MIDGRSVYITESQKSWLLSLSVRWPYSSYDLNTYVISPERDFRWNFKVLFLLVKLIVAGRKRYKPEPSVYKRIVTIAPTALSYKLYKTVVGSVCPRL